MVNERRHQKQMPSYENQTPGQLKLANQASSLLINDITAAQKMGATECLSHSNRLDSTEREGGSYNIGGGVLGQAKIKKDNSY